MEVEVDEEIVLLQKEATEIVMVNQLLKEETEEMVVLEEAEKEEEADEAEIQVSVSACLKHAKI